ncbi:MAG: hypothetical protein ACT4QD_06165 [Acidobacteriota bacterium]
MTSRKPSSGLIAICGVGAVAAITVGVYAAGSGQTPLAMVGAGLFVVLGGLTFELVRRRSV